MAGFDPKAYLAADDSTAFDPKAYAEVEDDQPGLIQKAVQSNLGRKVVDSLPIAFGTVGGILGTPGDVLTGPAGTIGGAALGGYLGTSLKNTINSYFDPSRAPRSAAQVMIEPVSTGAMQGLAQGAGEAVAPYVAKGISSVASPVSDWFASVAAKKAVNATGATGKQAAKFADDAGQQLLDRGIVGFGNSQATIADKAAQALEDSGNKIGSVLEYLDKRGATLDQNKIVSSLRQRAAQLGKDPAQFGVSKQLRGLADDIESMVQNNAGESKIPLSQAEVTKRGFQQSANYNSSPLDLSVSKEAANIYRQEVENAATAFDPKSAAAFKQAKDDYSLLSPISEAANKRAATLAQSPHGGLLDTATQVLGEGVAGVPGMIVAPIVRRGVATRSASSMAAASNGLSKLLAVAPDSAGGIAQVAVRAPTEGSQNAVGSALSNLVELPADASDQNKGPDAWAAKGLQNLGIQDRALSQKLLSDPRAKQLLVNASSFAPGSQALKNIMSQIQKGWGQG